MGALTLEVAQGEMLIELHPQVDRQERAQLWAQAGVEVLDYIPGLGLYRVRVQSGADLAGALAAMGRRPEVSHVGPNPVARGAASQAQGIDPQAAAALQILDEGLLDQMSELPSLSAIEAPALLSLMWYAAGHSRLQPDGWPTAWQMVPSAEGVTVAILDSGIAPEAPSLACADIAQGYDFINEDAEPRDDHQHGTHLASLLLADPRCGAMIRGYAVGATLLPVKVLGADLTGTELQIAQGIQYAVAEGADVINMSLSFGQGYTPGLAMQRALQAAAESNVILVGSAGNSGDETVAFPAAAPHVIAVGAYERPTLSGAHDALPEPSAYGNFGAALDVLAPGGSLERDVDGDGVPDGVVAETFNPAAPDQFGYWVAAGTSQAAVAVTGLVALMLKQGMSEKLIRPTLSATSHRPDGDFSAHYGNGLLRPALALAYTHHEAFPGESVLRHQYQVGLVALEESKNKESSLQVAVVVREGTGGATSTPLSHEVSIYGHWAGEVVGSASCQIPAGQTHCVIESARFERDGAYLATFFVDRVQRAAAPHPLDRWAAQPVGYYGLSEADAEAVIEGDDLYETMLFSVSPDSEIVSHLFGQGSARRVPTYNARNLGASSGLPPGVAALSVEEDIAEGNGMGASSLIFDFAWYMIYDVESAAHYGLGNGMGASSLEADFSLLLNGLSALSAVSLEASWEALGNGMGASSLVFESYQPYAAQSMEMSYYSVGMSSGDEEVGMTPLD